MTKYHILESYFGNENFSKYCAFMVDGWGNPTKPIKETMSDSIEESEKLLREIVKKNFGFTSGEGITVKELDL